MRGRTWLAAASLSLLIAAPGGAQTSCEWRTIDTDDPRSGNFLFGIGVQRTDRVWAAGTRTTDRGHTRTYVRFWDGSGWQRQRTPNPSDVSNQLNDVDAGGRGAVWAVGEEGSPVLRTIALRKTSRGWKRTNSVDPSGSLNALNSVSAYSRRHVWAVGTRWDSSGDHVTLIERWRQGRWRVTGPALEGILHGVSASAADDVWAVGVVVRNGVGRTLTMHFNGRRWREVPSPNENGRGHVLLAVDASARSNAWAVGYRAGRDGYSRPIALHWNGTRWRLVDTPNSGPNGGRLDGVSTVDGETIAVGERGTSSWLLVREGTGWRVADTTRFEDSDLADVEHAPDGSAFVAGARTTRGGSETVAYRPPC